jgi:hypothetical protein
MQNGGVMVFFAVAKNTMFGSTDCRSIFMAGVWRLGGNREWKKAKAPLGFAEWRTVCRTGIFPISSNR